MTISRGHRNTVGESPDEVVLAAEHLSVTYTVRGKRGGPAKQQVHAVHDVSFQVKRGETFAIVGESGCGKTSTGKALLDLVPRSAGTVTIEGEEFAKERGSALRELRRRIQMVFQDPYSSLNPRMRVGTMLNRTQKILGTGNYSDRRARTIQMLETVGLGAEYYRRYPSSFSGGQRQRLGIARALIGDPDVIICDEPVSALDVSIQAQILNLLKQLQRDLGVAYVFISHDLGVVRYLSDRAAVMYLGEIVEEAPTGELFSNPLHPYTKVLMSAIPDPVPGAHRERIVVSGEVPSPLRPPTGCKFHTRCPFAMPVCSEQLPRTHRMRAGHQVACHLYSSSATPIQQQVESVPETKQ